MKKGNAYLMVLTSLFAGAAVAAEHPKDVFKGKLFALNVILERREQLRLTGELVMAIREAVAFAAKEGVGTS